MKEALLVYGDLIATMNPTIVHPFKLGEENALLGVVNSCTFVTRSFALCITLDLAKFFNCIREANPKTIQNMKSRCSLKMKNVNDYIKSKLRGEVLKEEMGYFTKHKRMIPDVEKRAREMVSEEIVPRK